jgi:hypothetical protein
MLRSDAERTSAAASRPPRDDLTRLARRIRRIVQSGWPGRPEFAPFQPVWELALRDTHRLTTAADDTDIAADPARLLDRIETQLALAEFTRAAAVRLRPLAAEIVSGAETSARRLWNLTHEWHGWLSACEPFPALLPEPGFSLEGLLERDHGPPGTALAQSVLSARLLAAVWPALDLPQAALAELLLAALVQEIGTLHARGGQAADRNAGEHSPPHPIPLPRSGGEGTGEDGLLRQRDLAMLARRAHPLHPAAGAALLNGLRDGSVALGLLVGAHHERLDGTGFPQRLSGRRLPRAPQVLGLVVRLTEYLLDPLTSQLATEHHEPLLLTAGLRLWREVRRGAFDAGLARALLDPLHPGLADTVDVEYATRVTRFVDPPHDLAGPRGRTSSPEAGEAGAGHAAFGPPAFLRHPRSGRGVAHTARRDAR